MFKGIATVALLIISNAFMTLAWYGHIAFKSKLERFGMLAIVLLSWGIALFEYCFQVPANRIGSSQFGGPFSIWELKVIQEVVSLSVFTLFALVFMKSDSDKIHTYPPGPSFPVTHALPAGHGGKSDTSSRSSARNYLLTLVFICILTSKAIHTLRRVTK